MPVTVPLVALNKFEQREKDLLVKHYRAYAITLSRDDNPRWATNRPGEKNLAAGCV
jgi:hypothetical protein